MVVSMDADMDADMVAPAADPAVVVAVWNAIGSYAMSQQANSTCRHLQEDHKKILL